jgi:GAF domain-containing protein
MSTFNLLDYIFKDRPGEATGKRAELIVTLALGCVVTGFWAIAYQNTVVVFASTVTSLMALVSLIQTVRGKANYPMLFPAFVMISVTAISLLDGKGVHDLIWMSSIGVFLLVNIYSNRNNDPSIYVFSILILSAFIVSGVLELNGVLTNPFGTDLKYIMLNSALLLGVMGAIATVFHRHRSLLHAAEDFHKEQLVAQEKLREVNLSLESQVRIRTDELRVLNEELLAKTAKLQASSEISWDIMNNQMGRSGGDLLVRAARLISERLGYYHVGIFAIDTLRGFAVLRATNSKGGQEMLENRHQLKIGGTGIVSYVSQSGRPRIALDTGVDAVFFNNPFLPETRSEISLPIIFENTVIGVLDVQSTQPAAFQEDDINPLMTIANQLAIVMQKSNDSSFDLTKGGRQSAHTASWNKQMGYAFHADGTIVSVNAPAANLPFEKLAATGEMLVISHPVKGISPTLAVPVKLRDQVIGIIHIETEEATRNWSEAEIQLVLSISERAALALENARLFEDATRRAEQEETISRITTQIGASTDFDRIMQTTIQELGVVLGASRSFIQIGSAADLDGKASE